MRIARGILEGKLELSDALMERIFLCNQCLYCASRCDFKPVEMMFALKADIVRAGRAPSRFTQGSNPSRIAICAFSLMRKGLIVCLKR